MGTPSFCIFKMIVRSSADRSACWHSFTTFSSVSPGYDKSITGRHTWAVVTGKTNKFKLLVGIWRHFQHNYALSCLKCSYNVANRFASDRYLWGAAKKSIPRFFSAVFSCNRLEFRSEILPTYLAILYVCTQQEIATKTAEKPCGTLFWCTQ